MVLINRLLRVMLGLLIAALVVTVAMGVIYRYALKDSLFWATEVPRIILIWIVFLGSVVAYDEKKHIAFTALVGAFSQPVRTCLEIVSCLILLFFLVLITYFGAGLVTETMGSASEALKIPQGYIYSCLPISTGLMVVSTVKQLFSFFRS